MFDDGHTKLGMTALEIVTTVDISPEVKAEDVTELANDPTKPEGAAQDVELKTIGELPKRILIVFLMHVAVCILPKQSETSVLIVIDG